MEPFRRVFWVPITPQQHMLLMRAAVQALPESADWRCRSEGLFLLLERLPLGPSLVECPICRGGGDFPERDTPVSCTGECCQTCPFCRGLRFLESGNVRCTPVMDGASFSVQYRQIPGGPVAPNQPDLRSRMFALSQAMDSAQGDLLRQTSPEYTPLRFQSDHASGHVDLPLVRADVTLLGAGLRAFRGGDGKQVRQHLLNLLEDREREHRRATAQRSTQRL